MQHVHKSGQTVCPPSGFCKAVSSMAGPPSYQSPKLQLLAFVSAFLVGLAAGFANLLDHPPAEAAAVPVEGTTVDQTYPAAVQTEASNTESSNTQVGNDASSPEQATKGQDNPMEKALRAKRKQASRDAKNKTETNEGKKGSGSEAPQFVRLLERKGEPQSLQTAIVSYRPAAKKPPNEGSSGEKSEGSAGQNSENLPENLQIDLVGVIHIGEQAYYEQLNRILRSYDVVLYELVAPEGTRAEPGVRPAHPISAIQMSLKNFLGLSFQLDVIDYHRPNFVHADMSPEEFSQSMAERGESLWAMFLRAFGYEFARNQMGNRRASDADFLVALFSKDRQLQMKRIFASQLAEDVSGQIRALEGPQGSTLISGRNEKVIQVLRRQIEAGHRKIAIFYGAGHMEHFHQRLKELGLSPAKTRWLDAWDLRGPASEDPS